MTYDFARYRLGHDGTIQHWLACGPAAPPLRGLEAVLPTTGKPHGHQQRWTMNYWAYHPEVKRLKQRVYQSVAPFTWQPSTAPVVDQPAFDGRRWRYAVARDDRMIDFSRFNFVPSLMLGWAYTIVVAEQEVRVPVEIYTIGPVQLWHNESLAHQFDETFSYVAPLTVRTHISLNAGENRLYLHGLMPGWREARLALGMRLLGSPAVEVRLPIGAISPEKWHSADTALNHLNLKQFAVPDLPAMIELDASAPAAAAVEVTVSLPVSGSPWAQFASADVPQATAHLLIQPGQSARLPLTDEIAKAMARLPGENALTLTIRPDDGTPIRQTHALWASSNRFSLQPYADYETRRREAVEHLAAMYDFDVFAAMAAVETGRKQQIASSAVGIACEFLNQRKDCADFYALSLLSLLNRFGKHPALRREEHAAIESAFLSFKYWIDEPGLDGMCYCTENHQILFHVTGYLAGQYWPDRMFANSGFTGKQQMARALPRIRSWILRRLQGGFSEWDSNAYLTMDVFSMLALVEFANSPRLREMATTLLHKTFFMISAQSFRGAHGSTHGRCYVEGLKSARAENSSNIQRIAWGMGIFNGETRATGLLSMARRYRLPDILQKIGADVDRTIVTRVRSSAKFRPEFDMHRGQWDIRTITRRTSDYMLSAVVDHRPGAMGVQEHLWQATLGPEAVVFTNYPGNNQQHGQARPNFWAGSVKLPRVAMTGATVICLYRIDPDIGLGFSHAYFPTAYFDEWLIDGQWAFARSGSGYVALWGDGDLRQTTTGPHALQEVRSSGLGRAWLCTVGSADEYGDFAAFCRTVRANAPRHQDSELRWQMPDGRHLTFGWSGPLRLDGRAADWDSFPHYANTYTHTPLNAPIMEIRHGSGVLRLDLQHGRTLSEM